MHTQLVRLALLTTPRPRRAVRAMAALVEPCREVAVVPVSRIIVCGSTCGHDHDSLNGPTGCCAVHGPYMYFCGDCHGEPPAARTEGHYCLDCPSYQCEHAHATYIVHPGESA